MEMSRRLLMFKCFSALPPSKQHQRGRLTIHKLPSQRSSLPKYSQPWQSFCDSNPFHSHSLFFPRLPTFRLNLSIAHNSHHLTSLLSASKPPFFIPFSKAINVCTTVSTRFRNCALLCGAALEDGCPRALPHNRWETENLLTNILLL